VEKKCILATHDLAGTMEDALEDALRGVRKKN